MKASRQLTSSFFILHPSSFILSVLDLSQQRIGPLGLLFDRVAHEVKRGSMAQIEREAKLLADIRRGAAQRDEGQLVFMLIASHRDKDAGVTQIVGDSHVGYGDHSQTRVFQLVTDNLRDLFTQGIGDALRAMHDKTRMKAEG